MKALLILLFSILLNMNVFANEKPLNLNQRKIKVQQVLHKNQLSEAKLNKSNLAVLLGELTGAGKFVPLKSFEGIIHENGVLFKNQIDEMIVNEKNAPAIADITTIFVGEKKLKNKDVLAILIKK